MEPCDFTLEAEEGSLVEPVAVVLPGGQRITFVVVPLTSVRRAWAAHPGGPISRVLTQAELAVSGMHAVVERRMAHLAGRIAAKFALIAHLGAQGHPLEARDLGLTQMMAGPEEGRPVAQLPAGVPACDVSITHSHALALAVVTSGGRVGVDLERVAPRAAAFQEEVFTPVERVWFEHQGRLQGRTPDEMWSLGWCLKEAWVKCTGQGLRAALQQVSFSGWTELGGRDVHLAPLTEGPDAFVRFIHLELSERRETGVTGLVALGQGYALAALHDAREPGAVST
ncbi:4'-phosphopantetheinyl transferase family protein [Hyalangium minutum]|uniref:Modular polyketide synthase n=1 Tax=Hyalangium minutum TaxID=394096 RepID=A0A085WPB0_9BACT|nr:4'-phosphopantetheinyl transferase superfamily protein [Hyalangium minutum]KFE69523.1 Modular polyketide synthase [Hyalangium minutum]